MTTIDKKYALLKNNKLLPYELMNDQLQKFLQEASISVFNTVFRGAGTLDAATPVTGTAIGEVSVAGAFQAIHSGDLSGGGPPGYVPALPYLDVDALNAELQDVPFENAVGITYQLAVSIFGMYHELDVNPRTGVPEYRQYQQQIISKVDTPDAVVDNGTDITFTVDVEPGVSHAGREVTVMMVAPVALTWAIAAERLTVSWDGSNNTVTTSGLLGQTAGSVSLATADYLVSEHGPRIVRQPGDDLKTDDSVIFLADFVGNAGSAPTPDMTDQNVMTGSLSDLADITRIGTNGDLKVSVRAHALDSGEDQLRSESAAGARVWGVDEAGLHSGPTSTVGSPIDDATVYGQLALPWVTNSLRGSANQAMVMWANTSAVAVLDGLGYASSPGAGVVNFNSGQAWVPGVGGFSGGIIDLTTPQLTITDGTRWVFADLAGFDWTATKANAYAAGKLPMFRVVMAAGVVSEINEIAYRVGTTNRAGVLTVSSAGSGTQKTSNFTTLQAALDFVNYQNDQDSAIYPAAEIWLLDDIDCGTAAFQTGIGCDGLTIRGMGGRGRAVLSYGDAASVDNCPIYVQSNNVSFVDIHFRSDVTGPGTGTAAVAADEPVLNPDITGTRFVNCKVSSTNNNLAIIFRGAGTLDSWTNVLVDHCEIYGGPGHIVLSGLGTAAGDIQWSFRDCELESFAGGNSKLGLNEPSVTWVGCRFTEYAITGLNTNGDLVPKFYGCSGTLGALEEGHYTDCNFTDTSITPEDAPLRLVNCSVASASGTLGLIILNDVGASLTAIGCKLHSASGYFMSATSGDRYDLIGCQCTGASLTGDAMTLSLKGKITGCVLGPFRTVYAADQMIHITVDEVELFDNEIHGDAYEHCAYVNSADKVSIIGNQFDGGAVVGSQTGVHFNGASLGTRVTCNAFRNIGDATNGGIAVYVSATTFDVVITGNTFEDIEGAGVHLDACEGVVVNSNCFKNVGNTTATGVLGVTSRDAITLNGSDYCTVAGNTIDGADQYGIRLKTGCSQNSVTGNVIKGTGSTEVILDSGSTNNVAQLNVGGGTAVVDNGSNMVGANATNNNY